jgi:hypothetical protein
MFPGRSRRSVILLRSTHCSKTSPRTSEASTSWSKTQESRARLALCRRNRSRRRLGRQADHLGRPVRSGVPRCCAGRADDRRVKEWHRHRALTCVDCELRLQGCPRFRLDAFGSGTTHGRSHRREELHDDGGGGVRLFVDDVVAGALDEREPRVGPEGVRVGENLACDVRRKSDVFGAETE